ncbi:MAG: bifunctional UDP-sugar hydrolase/5'-nucleotidase [Pseudohongiellaceae bacterium]
MMKATVQKTVSQILMLILMGWVLSACASLTEEGGAQDEMAMFTVLYTNDEHGWMEGMEEGQGAANLFELWKEEEGFSQDGAFLVLSGGDNWTGPAISTWVQGQSMVELMNAMDYDASAVGNHEFDFGLQDFSARAAQADFPYLSANTLWKETGEHPVDLGILPYTLTSVAGVNVAIIGLTTTSTPTTTMPSVVAPLAFTDYEVALRKVMPEIHAHNPDVLIVVSHVCMNELRPLALAVEDLDIALIGAGHCNELVAEKIGSTVVVGGGFHFSSYAKAQIQVNRVTEESQAVSFSTHQNKDSAADSALASIVSRWRDVSEETLSERLGFSEREWQRSSDELQQSIVDAWLEFDTTADIALTNGGGIRAPLAKGEISLGTIVAIMPFSNTIIATDLTGAEIAEVMAEATRPVIAGMRMEADQWVLDSTNAPLAESTHYRVLVNSFMYDGGDGYGKLARFDPEGFDTAVHYREPFVQWLKKIGSSVDQPLVLD